MSKKTALAFLTQHRQLRRTGDNSFNAWVHGSKDKDVDRRERFCSCGNERQEPHPCPFALELYDDDTNYCTCCSKCTNECAMDV